MNPICLSKAGPQKKKTKKKTVILLVSTHFAFGVNGWGFGLLLIFVILKVNCTF